MQESHPYHYALLHRQATRTKAVVVTEFWISSTYMFWFWDKVGGGYSVGLVIRQLRGM
ncbi:hypothetical protein DAEQUDRAFT_730128 [Daedalea quercina L-15889]|uniref:Uncharacterized protein n=1 Tax=Daedalea quercina L-15889 TaxID=1314783 RepID=A0A165N622_9APHY|nr:hypothetical protein DAEQUDRAFT_730128 [Daedalea quercina L-15889]